nr:MAG TPA: hypothetical protein [Crassvirales sp.]
MNDFVDHFANDFNDFKYDFVNGDFSPLCLVITISIASSILLSSLSPLNKSMNNINKKINSKFRLSME